MNSTLKNLLLMPMNILYKISPTTELKLMFYIKRRYKLNLNRPNTFSEKLNWMKLYYKNELVSICSDKYTVRQYVQECGCGDILTELFWEGYDAKEIPFDNLPQQFVIKVTHGSGNNIICKNKDTLNREKTIKQLNRWLKQKYFPCYGEWFYRLIRPRIIIEQFLSEDNVSVPADYKMFCFNNVGGNPGVGVTSIISDRFTDHKCTFYDTEWNIMPDIIYGFPSNSEKINEKPELYEKMVEYAKILSHPFPHVRVDFYIIKDKLYFGELTFMTGAGYIRIKPFKFDETMGNWIQLPSREVGYIGN